MARLFLSSLRTFEFCLEKVWATGNMPYQGTAVFMSYEATGFDAFTAFEL